MQEGLRQQFNEAVATARKFARSKTIAVYRTRGGIPDHIGTAHILAIRNEHYLVTAAHVIDEVAETAMYCGLAGTLGAVEGIFQRTRPITGVRDPYDYAFLRLEGPNLRLLQEYEPIPEQLVSHNRVEEKGRFYMAVGYPNSKNKKHDNIRRSVTPRKAHYTGASKTDELASALDLDASEHLILGYGKQSYDEEFNLANSTHLRGLSGGPMFDIGSPLSVQSAVFGNPTPMLSAVVVEYDKQRHALICVKSHIVVQSVRESTAAA